MSAGARLHGATAAACSAGLGDRDEVVMFALVRSGRLELGPVVLRAARLRRA